MYTSEIKKKIIIDYIRKHPRATHRSIKKATKLHVIRSFKSLKEAYRKANVSPPRTFDLKTKDEKKKIIIDYIRKHPRVGGHTIMKETKINFNTIFKNIEGAYKAAGVRYPREIDKRTKEEKRKLIIKAIRDNPLVTITELTKNLKLSPYKYFKNLKEIYSKEGIDKKYIHKKRLIKKQLKVIEFIKSNPFSTQREINTI